MAAKTVVLLLAVLALAAAEAPREKKAVVYAEDDGSYFPGKYEGTGLPVAYSAAYPYNYGYAARAYPYAAYPYSAYPYAGYPYAHAAYPYAPAARAVVAPVAPVAPVVPVVRAASDDGSYFPGKYGPEHQL